MKAGYNVFEAKIIQYISETELLFLNFKLSFCFLLFFGSIKSYNVRKLLGGVILKRGTKNTIY